MRRLPERIQRDALNIRRWEVSDAEVQHQAILECADHLRPWMGWMADEPQTLDERRAMIAGWENEWAGGGDVYLGVFVDDDVAGSCGLHRRRGPRVLEIGYWVQRAFLRRGIATAIGWLLTDAAFTVPGITHVEIHHDKANVASAGVPRRLGYQSLGEEPDQVQAPSEVGIDCRWRIARAEWTSPYVPPTTGPRGLDG